MTTLDRILLAQVCEIVRHAFPSGPAHVIEGQQASCLVTKQAVEFPQVLASIIYLFLQASVEGKT